MSFVMLAIRHPVSLFAPPALASHSHPLQSPPLSDSPQNDDWSVGSCCRCRLRLGIHPVRHCIVSFSTASVNIRIPIQRDPLTRQGLRNHRNYVLVKYGAHPDGSIPLDNYEDVCLFFLLL
jgi:hypothetical protein